MCVAGFIWAEIKEMWDGGFTEYIHDWWNLMDFAMNSLYLATISLKIVAYVKVKTRVRVCEREKGYGKQEKRKTGKPDFCWQGWEVNLVLLRLLTGEKMTLYYQ